ncbi:MAG: choice-of-anchor J domain-containing protein [Bacteroidota bacterium]
MKKTLFLIVAIAITVSCFGQIKSSQTKQGTKYLSKTWLNADNQNLLNSKPKVIQPTGFSQAKVNYMTQNFDGTFVPTGWTQTILLTTKTWMQGNPTADPFTNIDPTNVFSAFCPYSLPAETQSEWLKSPSITGTSGAAALFLQFWAGYSYDYLPAGGLGNPGATLQCKISSDGGSTWTTLWDANNTPAFTGWVWRQVLVDISAYKSAPFMLAWHVSGADGDLIALDNAVVLEPPANDAGVSGISSPITTCSLLSSSQNIVVTIQNSGSSPISGFDVSYKINNGTAVTANYTGTIAGGASAVYTFTGAYAANMSTAGTYNIKSYTSLGGDVNATNDTAYASVAVGAASVPVIMGFESTENLQGWTVLDANTDGYTWGLYTGTGHTGTDYIGYSYNTASAANDWFFTKCTNLNSGTNYVLKFWYRGASTSFTEKMRVKIGTAPTAAGMTTQLVQYANIASATWTLSSTNFTVPSSGVYYIGFQCYSAADQYDLYMDDISVDVLVGVDENTVSAQTEVYPNPASNLITVNAPEKIRELSMLNMLGSLVYSQVVNANTVSINTTALQNGIYFIKIETESGTITKKIQVIR